jgi:plastocyanin
LRSNRNQSHKRGRPISGTLPHFFGHSLSRRTLGFILVGLTVFVTPQIYPRPVLATNSTYHVTIVDFAYQPQHINLTTGMQVTWTYSSSGQTVHTVTSTPQTNVTAGGTPLISSGQLNPGQSFTYTFYKHGIYPIQCALHPTIPAMNGWVNVTGTDLQPPPSSTPSSDSTLYVIIGVVAGALVIVSAGLFFRGRTRRARGDSPLRS